MLMLMSKGNQTRHGSFPALWAVNFNPFSLACVSDVGFPNSFKIFQLISEMVGSSLSGIEWRTFNFLRQLASESYRHFDDRRSCSTVPSIPHRRKKN